MEKEEFLRLLPKLIREDDEVKGAIITALSGVVSTKSDIERVIEQSDKRFETLILQINKEFSEVKNEIKKIQVAVGSIGDRSGKALEDTIIELLSDKIIQENIQASKIHKKYLKDEEGVIFTKNYTTDIDVLIENDKIILIDIKYHTDNRKIFNFLKRAELYSLIKKPYNKLITISLEIEKKYLEYAAEQGIKVITGKVI